MLNYIEWYFSKNLMVVTVYISFSLILAIPIDIESCTFLETSTHNWRA